MELLIVSIQEFPLGPKVLCQITTKNQVHVVFLSLVTYRAFATYRDVKINKYAL